MTIEASYLREDALFISMWMIYKPVDGKFRPGSMENSFSISGNRKFTAAGRGIQRQYPCWKALMDWERTNIIVPVFMWQWVFLSAAGLSACLPALEILAHVGCGRKHLYKRHRRGDLQNFKKYGEAN